MHIQLPWASVSPNLYSRTGNGFAHLCLPSSGRFVAGVPPFNADTPQAIFERILDGNIVWPTDEDGNHMMSEDCRDLISKLLNPVPNLRLGYRGAGEIKMHKFFEVRLSVRSTVSVKGVHAW